MSAKEVVYRLVQSVRKRRLEWQGAANEYEKLSVLPGSSVCFALPPLPADLCSHFSAHYGEIAERALGQSRNVFSLLGLPPQDFGSPIDWYRDPVTNHHWPAEISAFRINFRHQDRLGEIKYVWELGRMPWLVPRAIAAHVLGSQAVAQTVVEDILSFIDSCPPYRGIHWTSGLELAVRVVNWTWALALIQPIIPIAADRWKKIARYVALSASYCAQLLSRFSSANNHLIGEATALAVAGSCWQVTAQHEQFARLGETLLRAEIPRQILSDGSCVEISPQYLKEDLEWALCACATLWKRPEDVPWAWQQRFTASADFLRALSCGRRLVPLADNDEAQILPMGLELSPKQFADVLACRAGAELSTPRDPEVLLACWLYNIPVAAEGAQPLAAKTLSRPPSRLFLPSGHLVISGKGSKLVADFAAHGFAPLYAHAHADALSVAILTEEEDVLVDPGTYCYHGERHWRNWFRSTKAHNTIELNDKDQSEMKGPFLWGRVAQTCLERWSVGEEIDCTASHDGYAPLIHKRRIVYRTDDCYYIDDLVLDRTKPCGFAQKVVIWWHFGPGKMNVAKNRLRWVGRHYACEMVWEIPEKTWSVQEYCGDAKAPQGWMSPRFSERLPAPAVAIILNDVKLPLACRTTISIERLFH